VRQIGLIFVALLTSAACGCVSYSPPGVRWLDDPLVYQPARYPVGKWEPSDLQFEDANFQSADGKKLHGWYCPAANPRAVVLMAHGNAGNLSCRADRLRMMQKELNVSAMMFDYRGFGKSEGLPTEKGVLLDARAARKWLAERVGVEEGEIVVMGESLGGGVAVDLAAKDGARGLILESTFTSLPDVASGILPYTPVRYLMRNRLDSLAKITEYRGPLLQAHGDADTLIPIALAKKLHEAAPGPKQFVTIPGAGHNWSPTPEYVQQLNQFFELLARNDGKS
jgi:uncharacterized protein